MTDFNSLIAEFGRQVQENLRTGNGEPEAQLTTPVATLLQNFGALHSMKVVPVRETSLRAAGGAQFLRDWFDQIMPFGLTTS